MSEKLPNSGLFGNFVGNEQDWGDRMNANLFIMDQLAAPAIDRAITAPNDSNVIQIPGTPHLYVADNSDHGQIWIFSNRQGTTNVFTIINPAPGRRISFQGTSLVFDTTITPHRWVPQTAQGVLHLVNGTEVIDCERTTNVLADLQDAATITFDNYRRGQILHVGIEQNGNTLTAPELSDAGWAGQDGVFKVMFKENQTTNPSTPFLIVS